MVAITERALGTIAATLGKTLVTVTGSETEVAIVLAVGTGLTDPLHRWSGDDKDIVWQTGVVGAMSVAYISKYPTTA
jgi:hypothetical protein